ILNEEPEAVSALRADVPETLQQIVRRMLAKKLQERDQNAQDIFEDLKGISEQKIEPRTSTSTKTKYAFAIFGTLAVLSVLAFFFIYPQKNNSGTTAVNSTAKIQRIAVLPFTNIRKDPQTDFLGFALADQIIGSLSYLKNILVRPSSAIRKYEKEIIEIASAGSELRVDYILTGNYLKQEDLVRLNVELVTVNSNELLWRELIEVKYENTFTLQDIVAEKIVNGLKLQFTPDERKGIRGDVPQNPLAYEYYLRGVAFPHSNIENQLAVKILKKSIELDSSYAPVFSELGFRLNQIATYTSSGKSKHSKHSEMAFLKALSLNGKLVSALGGLSAHYTETGQIEKSVALLRRSLEINPTNADNHFYLGYAYRYAGLLEKAKEEMEKALAIDPQNRRFRSIGVTYMYLGDYKKALQGFGLDNGSAYCFSFKGQVYMRMNQPDKALEYFNLVFELEPDGDFSQWVDIMKAYIEGDIEKGLSLARSSEQIDYTDGEQWYNHANLYGLLGDEEGCVRLLKKAVEGGFFCYAFMLSDTFLDPVRDNPEFQEVLKSAKKKHEAFKERFFSDKL
ncbi:MAG: tetratricopeptide repeat protein, partial [Candidatus Scalindua sp.]